MLLQSAQKALALALCSAAVLCAGCSQNTAGSPTELSSAAAAAASANQPGGTAASQVESLTGSLPAESKAANSLANPAQSKNSPAGQAPGKSSSATARAKSSSAPAKSQPGSPSSAQSVAANCSAGHAYANGLCSRCGKINPSGNLYKALGLWLKKHGNQTGNSQGYYLGREIGGFSITYDNRYPNEFEIAYYSEQPFENLSLTVSAAGSCSVYYSVGDYTTVNGHAPSNTAAHFEINKNSGVTAQQITFTDFYSKSTPKITQADFAKQSAAKTECSLKAANALLKPTGLSLKNFGFTGNYA